ncbi:hypothetical protein PIB30_084598 [Stylosanthes scabra]|uniref:Uncharacterized protein n=1 Tax=Stylosanthes scabra TaxID=79078 RepID=A0ABU6RT71_9FABA|nr:hypothetical protein [Stylosanthes scabra]
MFQDKYVRDVLSSRKLEWIKEVFELNYFEVIYDDCMIVKTNAVEGQKSGRKSLSMKKPVSVGTSRVGDGETIRLLLRKSYENAYRLYIPIHFASVLLTVIGPNPPKNNYFRFKFVKHVLQHKVYFFAGGYRNFCSAYKGKLKKSCQLKIVSMSKKLIEASFQD